MQNVKVTRKGHKGYVPARLFMIFARKAPTAIIFRRGPSAWVQVIRWNTRTDEFEAGQWFHGRVYERRSDLSPDGSLLIYFASKITAASKKDTEYTYAWTAISKPPYLTALALWPKGNCWHGGGSFRNGRIVLLNHKPEVAIAHNKHRPQGLLVKSNPSAHGEDDPIYSMRLERDGWVQKEPWETEYLGLPEMFRTIRPGVREKLGPDRRYVIRLTRSIECLDYAEEFAVRGVKSSRMTTIDRASWVDWDQQGRLVFARDGKIFSGEINGTGQIREKLIIDLNPNKPESKGPPAWAKKW
jgi:hypothetical protein